MSVVNGPPWQSRAGRLGRHVPRGPRGGLTGAVDANMPLFVLAGFGAAAALAAQVLYLDDMSWAPHGVSSRPRTVA